MPGRQYRTRGQSAPGEDLPGQSAQEEAKTRATAMKTLRGIHLMELMVGRRVALQGQEVVTQAVIRVRGQGCPLALTITRYTQQGAPLHEYM